MKKTKLYIALSILLFTVSSCEKFLNVDPKNQLPREKALSTQQTYYDALNGVYLMLGDGALFGHDLTFGLIEQMARNHAIKQTDDIFYWNYSSETLRGRINTIWEKMYSTIANVNSILEEIDNDKGVFDDGIYELIKAELLTIRAHAHYTLVKLYAKDYNEDKNARGIPYRTVYKNPKKTPFSTIDKVYEYILKDLKDAELLFKEKDPCVAGFPFYGGATDIKSGASIKENRKIRFNYWTSIAIQARVYLSMNDYYNAYAYADKIISSDDVFSWIPERYIASDPLFYPEIINAIHVPKLRSFYETYFEAKLYTTSQDKNDYVANQVYDANTVGSFDVRLSLFNKEQSGTNDVYKTSKKYQQMNKSNIFVYSGYGLIPIVKFSEMHLIAIEAACRLNPNDLTKPKTRLETLRLNRGVTTKLNSDISADELVQMVIKEYRRDLYLEGQLFYQYKRHNVKQMPDLTTLGYMNINDKTYILPIPNVELEENK